jgi:hypothetical protein
MIPEVAVERIIDWLDPAAIPPLVCPGCLAWWSAANVSRSRAVESLRSHLLKCDSSPEQVAENFMKLRPGQ